MRVLTLVLLLSLTSRAFAKEFFIQIKNVKYTLEVIPEVHGIATDAFVDLQNMGKSEILKESVEGIVTNFNSYQSDDDSSDNQVVGDVNTDVTEVHDADKFLSCLIDVSEFLTVKKVRKSKAIEDTLADTFLVKKRGLNNGLCSSHLGESFNFIDDDSLLLVIQVKKKLSNVEFEKFFSSFLKSKEKQKDMNKYLAYEMMVSECAFDVLLNGKQHIDFNAYKERLIAEVKASESLFEEKYKAQNHLFEVKPTTDKLVKTIEELE
ncbi:MAG: hypothetical protein K9K67_05090 [Bacteriovoracaceae bacterium]|nr:hypothetical protein [Bacteriovoracaceae bacterium]